MTLYDELELNADCSFEEIKQQYRILAQQHHPDKGGDIEKFKKIKFAYEVLSDPIRRKQYDTDKTTNIASQQEAVNILANIFFSLIPKFDCHNGNLIEALRNEINQGKTSSHANNILNDTYIANLEIVKSKLKIKNSGEENILMSFIDKQLELRYTDRKLFQHRIKLADEMFSILDNYTYGFLEIINSEINNSQAL